MSNSQSSPRFKVGDKIRVLQDDGYGGDCSGRIFTITKVNMDKYHGLNYDTDGIITLNSGDIEEAFFYDYEIEDAAIYQTSVGNELLKQVNID